MLKVWVVLGIISSIAPLGFMDPLVTIINNSNAVKWLYHNNLLMSMVIRRYIL